MWHTSPTVAVIGRLCRAINIEAVPVSVSVQEARSSAGYYKPVLRKFGLRLVRRGEMQRGAVMLAALLAALVLASGVHGASFTYDFSKGLGGWTHSSAVSGRGERACLACDRSETKSSGFFIRTIQHKSWTHSI
jgi:hypothetical protein